MLTDATLIKRAGATRRALEWATNEVVKRYWKEKMCSVNDAKSHIYGLALDEALKHAHTAQDVVLILKFQRKYREWLR